MGRRRWVPARAALVVAAAILLQITLVSDLRIAGAVGDVALVVVVAAGITGGPDRGVAYGFAVGLAFDLVVDSPFGLTVLTYALVGYGTGLASAALQRTGGWLPVAVAGVAGVVHTALFTGLGNLVGVDYPFAEVPSVALAVGVVGAVLVLPAVHVLWWVHGAPEPDRLELMLR
ncbi:MAG TPA: rod shape-determining protein MreD [Acidimicrobiales bacterium]|nr:rod shape-determining protein MreD [Acidimicrobiales bacterium]